MTINWDNVITLEEKQEIEKNLSFERKNQEILQMNREANLADFEYQGGMYVADKESIQGTQNQCLLMNDEDPIPSPGGLWVLADNSTRLFTVAEFKDFSTAFFMRASNNFGVKKFHQSNITDMLNNTEYTVDDIRNYDCTVGWN
jgi:hypothetical protein